MNGTSTQELAFSDRERAALEFERLRWSAPGRRDQAIRDRFGMSPSVYAQWVNRIIDDPRALAYDPVEVRRLQRLRNQRRALRGRP